MNGNIEDIRVLEQCMLNAWPSTRVVHCDGWVFRLAGGYTKRANSAQAFAPSGKFEPVLANARNFYARHRQPEIFRLTPLANADADAVLEDNAYRSIDPTIVVSAPLTNELGCDGSVSVETELSHDWPQWHAAANGLKDCDLAGHIAILNTIALPKAFATWRVDDQPLAFGLGVLDHGRLGLFDIVTLSYARRTGGAHKIVSALLGWGQSNGAHTAWLSVLADNSAAIPLYTQFGFSERYRYHYRCA
ncbi:MAG: GNAT family N-acetyltransferase [Rhizomicrobium sp.]|jgi:ribosomal protein S18 acetylase RimI-like enzyme